MSKTSILTSRAAVPVNIAGQRIRAIGLLSPEDRVAIGYDETQQIIAIQLENGVILMPTEDPEGNNPGWLDVVLHDSVGPITFN